MIASSWKYAESFPIYTHRPDLMYTICNHLWLPGNQCRYIRVCSASVDNSNTDVLYIQVTLTLHLDSATLGVCNCRSSSFLRSSSSNHKNETIMSFSDLIEILRVATVGKWLYSTCINALYEKAVAFKGSVEPQGTPEGERHLNKGAAV